MASPADYQLDRPLRSASCIPAQKYHAGAVQQIKSPDDDLRHIGGVARVDHEQV
jgi:hypothetical protein